MEGKNRLCRATAAGAFVLILTTGASAAQDWRPDAWITSKAKLQRELDSVRKLGYALDLEEFAENLCCISVPVKDPHNGAVVAAISVAMPKIRFRRALVGRWRRQLEEKAALISPQLAFVDG